MLGWVSLLLAPLTLFTPQWHVTVNKVNISRPSRTKLGGPLAVASPPRHLLVDG